MRLPFDPKQERLMPDLSVASGISVMRRDRSWADLSELFETLHPQALGIVLPFSSQLHWYAYREARTHGVMTALAIPSNVAVLTGLMEEVPIEAVVTTAAAARVFEDDLVRVNLNTHIKAWLIVDTKAGERSFVARTGETRYTTFPW